MSDLTRRCLFPMAITVILADALAGLCAGAGEVTRVAISGYDPVAYFTDGHPAKGLAAFSSPFDDAVYYFASAEHQKMFAADPNRYAPYYSGYCALGVSEGVKIEANPEFWTISGGRLFLFQNEPSKTVFDKWADSVGIITKADANWPALNERK